MFSNTRPQGVQIPAGQLSEGKASPKTVLHVVPAQMVAVQYADENGDKHNTMLVKVGKQVYHAPNGEAWAAGLKPAADWLKNRVIGEVEADDVPVPDQDAVDVMPQDSVTMAVKSASEEIDAQNQETAD